QRAGLIDGEAGIQSVLLDGREDWVAAPPGGFVHPGNDACERESLRPEVARRGVRDEGVKRVYSEVRRAHEDDATRPCLCCHRFLLAHRCRPTAAPLDLVGTVYSLGRGRQRCCVCAPSTPEEGHRRREKQRRKGRSDGTGDAAGGGARGGAACL